MIQVKYSHSGFSWTITRMLGFEYHGGFATADDALRAAWARWPGVPALIYTSRP